MNLPFKRSHESQQTIVKDEMTQALGGVALPRHSTDPEILGLTPDEVNHRFSTTPGDIIAEHKVDNAIYELDLKKWRETEADTEQKLTSIVDTFTGQRLDPPKVIDDFDWARIYEKELGLIKKDYPNPKPTKPNTDL